MSSPERALIGKFASCPPTQSRTALGERTWRQLERRRGLTRPRRREPAMALIFVGACVTTAFALAVHVGLLGAILVTLCMGALLVRRRGC